MYLGIGFGKKGIIIIEFILYTNTLYRKAIVEK